MLYDQTLQIPWSDRPRVTSGGETRTHHGGKSETRFLRICANGSKRPRLQRMIGSGREEVVGRRPLALWGLWMMCAGLGVLMLAFSVQGSAVHPRGLTTSLLAVSGMFLFRASFALSLGPLPHVMTSELFPQEVRAAGVSVSWAANWWSNLLVAQSFPVLHAWLSTRLGAHGSMVMIFGGFVAFCLLGFVLVWWTLPETKGISLEKAGAQ